MRHGLGFLWFKLRRVHLSDLERRRLWSHRGLKLGLFDFHSLCLRR